MKCVVTDATNYDILVGQQVFYPLGFGLIIELKMHGLNRDGLLEMAGRYLFM